MCSSKVGRFISLSLLSGVGSYDTCISSCSKQVGFDLLGIDLTIAAVGHGQFQWMVCGSALLMTPVDDAKPP